MKIIVKSGNRHRLVTITEIEGGVQTSMFDGDTFVDLIKYRKLETAEFHLPRFLAKHGFTEDDIVSRRER